MLGRDPRGLARDGRAGAGERTHERHHGRVLMLKEGLVISGYRSDLGTARIGAAVRAIAILAAMVAAAVLTGGCDGASEALPDAEATAPPASVAAVEQVPGSTDEAPSPVGSDGGMPTLLDLGADKCVPCKMMAPILEELRETYAGQLDVGFIDVWKDPAPGKEYGIRVIPTQIFLDEHGAELFRHQGFMSREDILGKWLELGYEFEG
jgi:thioredoxin 1